MSRASTTKRSAKSCDVTFRLLEFDNHVEFHVSGDQSTSHDHLLDESNVISEINTSEALDQIRSRFFELSEFANQLDAEEKDRLYKRWEEELTQYSRALIGWSLDEWIEREKHVILF